MEGLVLLLVVILVVLYLQHRKVTKQMNEEKEKAAAREEQLQATQIEMQQRHAAAAAESASTVEELERQIASLAQFKDVRDADAMANQLRQAAIELKASAEQVAAEIRSQAGVDAARMRQVAALEAENLRKDANADATQMRQAATLEVDNLRKDVNAEVRLKKDRVEALLASANQQAEQIVRDANERAEKIAGDAYQALSKANQLEESIVAMKNVIEGYGDRYLKPTYSLLDELADAYGFEEAGQQLKQARERSKLMVEHGRAAACDYVERHRKETAVRFVLDAFNGKVDSILSRAKVDNFGTLEQQIRDASALVNNNGSAFRDARITPEYLDARLTELKWLTAVHALREQEKEEQRRIREQIREEEKARREIERALKEAAKEEETLHKAMEKARAQVAKATEAQRAELEAKLADLEQKLVEAEARNERALSMAQQTKAGHVYVISNIGSFGEDVYKVGMTRRLEPLDRVKELGDASVPFNFDVHAMIWCEDAPALERTLHKRFVQAQVNKVNPRKEFFRLPLAQLRQVVEEHEIEASWTMAAKAAEYRESQAIEQGLRDNPATVADWLRHQELAVEGERTELALED